MLGRSSLFASALAFSAVFANPIAVTNQVERAAPPATARRGRAILPVFSGNPGNRSSARRAAYGWSNRHAQRVAAKKRNVARHRKTARGHA
jgi:hypothetical protein